MGAMEEKGTNEPQHRATRRLIYIPVIHAEADMGSAGEALSEATARASEETKRNDLASSVERMWEGLQNRVLALALPSSGSKLYQDGLPVCGRELAIARLAAEGGSSNYKILLELVDRGGELVGTEDPRLLVQEHANLKRYLETCATRPRSAAARYSAESRRLTVKRDAFVRGRLDETLPPGGTGIIFMGLEHRVDEGLPSSIAVEYLIHRLPFHRQFRIRPARERGDG